MKKYIILSVVAVMALASCSTVDEDTTSSKAGTEPISLSSKVLGVSTRSASSTILQATQIAANNSVGIYIYDQGKTAVTTAGYGYENYQYTPNGSGALTLFDGQTAPCYSTSGSVDIYGYAPRFSSINTGFTTVQPFAVKDDQSSDADYIASDLIYGTHKNVPVGTDTKNIEFAHKLSKVNITLSADGTYGFRAADLSGATVKLRNVAKSGTIQLTDGTFTTPNNAAKGDITVFNVAASNTANSVSGSAVIVPQSFTYGATTSLIEITLSSGKVYQYIPTTDISFAAGTQYNYTILMKNTGISVSSSITEWNTSDDATGDGIKKTKFDLSKGDVVNITDNDNYTITGTTTSDNQTITISGNPTVTLDNVNIESDVALNIISGGSPIIIIKGDCKLTSKMGAGLQISSGSVTINGTGTLTAKGLNGPGIGSPVGGNFKDITINDLSVNATGYLGGSGIGTACYDFSNETACGTIHINKAQISAKVSLTNIPDMMDVESLMTYTVYPAPIGCGSTCINYNAIKLQSITINTSLTKDEFLSKLISDGNVKIGICDPNYGDNCSITDGITLTASDGTYTSTDGNSWTKQ